MCPNDTLVRSMQIKAIYENNVLKPLEELNLPENSEVRIEIKKNFSRLLDEVGVVEAQEDVDAVLKKMRERTYYG